MNIYVALLTHPSLQGTLSVSPPQIDFRVSENYVTTWPISVAAQSKTWVCGRTLAGITGSNLARSMVVCLL